jgi:hypothetical protein
MCLYSSLRALCCQLAVLLPCCFLGMAGVHAQVSITSSGGNAQGSGGSSSYSIGQTFVQSQISGTGSVLQGVQQAVALTNLSATNLGNHIVLVYPNPTTDYLELQLSKVPRLRYWLVLYDAQGKAMRKVTIDEELTALHLGDLPAATYTAFVYDEHQRELQTFKIIKLNQ